MAQVMVSNKKSSSTHNLLAHLAQIGLWIAHLEWFRAKIRSLDE